MLQDKLMGTYFGSMIGDFLGTTIEFCTQPQIKKRFPETKDYLSYVMRKEPHLSDETLFLNHSIDHFLFPDTTYEQHLGRLANFSEEELRKRGISQKMRKLISFYDEYPDLENPFVDNQGSGFIPLVLPLIQEATSQQRLVDLLEFYVAKTHKNANKQAIERYFTTLYALVNNERIDIPLLDISKIKIVTGSSEDILSTALVLYSNAHSDFNEMVGIALKTFERADYDTLFFATGALIGADIGFNKLPKTLIRKVQKQIDWNNMNKYVRGVA